MITAEDRIQDLSSTSRDFRKNKKLHSSHTRAGYLQLHKTLS